MRGLIVDYVGVLDGSDEEQGRWYRLLRAARESEVATAVLSNDPGGPGADHIRELEAKGIVDVVLLSGEIGAQKPDAEAFQTAAEALELQPNECVMVDDNIENVHGAVQAGLVGVYFQHFERSSVEIASLFDLEGEF